MAKVTEGDPYYFSLYEKEKSPFVSVSGEYYGESYCIYDRRKTNSIATVTDQDNASLIVDALNAAHITEPVYKSVERILDDHSAWIAAPNAKIVQQIALRAVLVAHRILTEALEEDAKT